MRLPGPRWGAYSAPRPPAGKLWVRPKMNHPFRNPGYRPDILFQLPGSHGDCAIGMRSGQRGNVFQCDTRQYVHCFHVKDWDTQNNTWTFIIGKHTWQLLFSPLDGAAISVDLCTMAVIHHGLVCQYSLDACLLHTVIRYCRKTRMAYPKVILKDALLEDRVIVGFEKNRLWVTHYVCVGGGGTFGSELARRWRRVQC